MFSEHKNSYLQKTTKLNPRLLNRAITEAFHSLPDPYDAYPPFERLTSHQPSIPIENVDLTRAKYAFGRWALPKLRRELHNKDKLVVLQATNSIRDLIRDPEKAFEAIQLRIFDRLADLMLDEEHALREIICMILQILASQYYGIEAILKNELIVKNLKILINDLNVNVRMKTASCIETMALKWMAADLMVNFGFIPLIINMLLKDEDEIILIHLNTLHHLMYGNGNTIAFEFGALNILVDLLDTKDKKVLKQALSCIALITILRPAKEVAVQMNLLQILMDLLKFEITEVNVSIAEALMMCTHLTPAKKQAAAIPGLPKRLLKLTKSYREPCLQRFAIRALTNVSEHPKIRATMKTHLDEIRDIIIVKNEPELLRYKERLIEVVEWEP